MFGLFYRVYLEIILQFTLFSEVAKKLKLSYSVSPPSDGGLWGEEKVKGIFTGLVGDIQQGR